MNATLTHSPQHPACLGIFTLELTINCFPLHVSAPKFQLLLGRDEGLAPSQSSLFHRGSSRWGVVLYWHLPFPCLVGHVSTVLPTKICFQACSYTLGRIDAFFPPSLILRKWVVS
jgi:hypothetical protein